MKLPEECPQCDQDGKTCLGCCCAEGILDRILDRAPECYYNDWEQVNAYYYGYKGNPDEYPNYSADSVPENYTDSSND
jgi:hypothetical protein